MTEWQWSAYEQLQIDELYALLAARQEVFILEQRCFYPDLDGIDRRAHHLLGWQRQGGERKLAAYLRCVAPGVKYAEASLGRVLSVPAARGTGIGKQLLEEGLRHAERTYPGTRIRISAQLYLRRFYESFGFRATSEPYDEDGIPHVEMLR
ncbi:MAG TPA: GNAT family N-acetyltransferase [Paucimonas sp.]|nr:GNAT family N-acetyltransferase [Paucimonas sp.]